MEIQHKCDICHTILETEKTLKRHMKYVHEVIDEEKLPQKDFQM